ncbi:hypothetical protein RHS01_07780 [Rhizoctonia solani]|uniref:Uncharacterized protein n=1 Tax=Rhizoctonia solani TaxID=456999 RepID=A0A8H7I6P8_9AGAM|nr:hypothetical protein RHS01_07780 [Rhizoctonia solani]
MDAPSTPNRPRQHAQVLVVVDSSLSPPPETEQTQEQEQGGATDETVPADDNISHIQTVAAVSPLDPQAPTASTTTPTSKKRRSPAEDDDDPPMGLAL